MRARAPRAPGEVPPMLRRVLLACVPASVAILIAGAPPAAASDACIPPKVVESLAACSGVDLRPPSSKRTTLRAARRRAPPVTSAPAAPAAARSQGLTPWRSAAASRACASGAAPRSPRSRGSRPCSRGRRRDRAGSPGLLKRLADGYVELEAASFRKKIESGPRGPHGGEGGDEVREGRRAQAAIKYYGQLKAQYPRLVREPGQSGDARPRAASTRRSTTSPTSTSRPATSTRRARTTWS